jgi:hypothetical protein
VTACDLAEPPLQLLARQRKGTLIGDPRIFGAAQPAQAIPASRMEEMITSQNTTGEDFVDERKTAEGPSPMAIATARSGSITRDAATRRRRS